MGKTLLVRHLAEAVAAGATVLFGAMRRAVESPRPLGPLLDIGRAAGGVLARALTMGPREPSIFALLTLLGSSRRLVVVVFETCTGPTRRRSTCCATWAAARPATRCADREPTATMSSPQTIHCAA